MSKKCQVSPVYSKGSLEIKVTVGGVTLCHTKTAKQLVVRVKTKAPGCTLKHVIISKLLCAVKGLVCHAVSNVPTLGK